MNILTEFAQRAPDSGATTAQQLIWANQGAKEIVRRMKCLPTSGNIDLTSGTASYDLISEFSTYQMIDPDGGVAYYDGSNYKPLKYVSEGWLDDNVTGWRNSGNAEPIAFYIKGKNIYLYPTPSATVTDGLKVSYYAEPTAMTADGDDPFNSRTDLEPYHELVVMHMLWKAKQALGEYAQARIHMQEYHGELQRMENEMFETEYNSDEPFRPYHKAPVQTSAHPNLWGT